MADKKVSKGRGADSLRKAAEERTKSSLGDLEKRVPTDAQELMHDLHVHMVELDLQNAELSQVRGDLEEARQQYWELFQHAPVGYMTLTQGSYVGMFNDEAAVLFGAGKERFKGASLYSLLHEDDRDALYLLVRRAITGIPAEAEVRVEGKDGVRWLRLLARTLPKSLPLLLTAIDITPRKQAEEALVREREGFRRLAENSPDMICRSDLAGRHLYVNPAAARFLGQLPENVVGKTLRELGLPEDLRRVWEEAVSRAIRLRQSVRFVLELPRTTTRRTYQAAVVPEFDRHGAIESVLVIARDITEMQLMQQRLRELRDRALDAALTKSQFLANMSHEIRTPMNGILGMLRLALKAELPDKVRKQLELADEAGYNLLGIINDILDISKIEAGKVDLASRDFDLRELLQALAAELEPQCREKGLSFVLSLEAALPSTVRGDPLRLRQILDNLLSNSLKFTRQGEVRLSAEAMPEESDEAAIHNVLFRVEDTGIGIPAHLQKRIFDSFTQGEDDLTKRYKGTGLGLAICKRLVKLFGGRIDFESVEGEGTAFHVLLPLQAAGENVATSCSSRPPQELGPLRLLLVEDERINQLFMLDMLQGEGHEVTVAANGAEAVFALAGGHFDAVLMDVQMPVMDGAEATRRIRRGEAGDAVAGIPVIGLSAYAMREDEERFMASGMDAYVTKPVAYGDLAAAIAAASGAELGRGRNGSAPEC